jgi:hypothetical protein
VTDPLDQLLRARGSAARAAAGDPFDRLHRSDRGDVERRAVRQQRRQQIAGLVATTVMVVGLGSSAARQQLAGPGAPAGRGPGGTPAGASSDPDTPGESVRPSPGGADPADNRAAHSGVTDPAAGGTGPPGVPGATGRDRVTGPATPDTPAATAGRGPGHSAVHSSAAGPGEVPPGRSAPAGAVTAGPSDALAIGPGTGDDTPGSGPSGAPAPPTGPTTTVAPLIRVGDGEVAADGSAAGVIRDGSSRAGSATAAGHYAGGPVRRPDPL